MDFADRILTPAAPPPTYTRDLTEADLTALSAPLIGREVVRPLQRVRHHHHLVAQLIASGKRETEVHAITGMSIARISNLVNHDPAFRELVALYKAQVEAQYVGVHQRAAHVAGLAIEELETRLEEAPQDIGTAELRKLAGTLLDRAAPGKEGAGATPGKLEVTINLVKAQHQELPPPTTIEGEAKEVE